MAQGLETVSGHLDPTTFRARFTCTVESVDRNGAYAKRRKNYRGGYGRWTVPVVGPVGTHAGPRETRNKLRFYYNRARPVLTSFPFSSCSGNRRGVLACLMATHRRYRPPTRRASAMSLRYRKPRKETSRDTSRVPVCTDSQVIFIEEGNLS